MSDRSEEESKDRTKIRAQLSNMCFEDLQKLKNEMGAKLYNKTVYGTKKPQTDFKRANKNRPREISSKRPLKLGNNNNNSAAVAVTVKKQEVPRDPRFDPLCGEFDKATFTKNYNFINDLRKREKNQLEKELNTAKEVDKKKNLKHVIQRLDNQIREQAAQDTISTEINEEKNEIKNKLKRGEKVSYKKKSVKRLENLIKKYESLKKSNKLQKHIERRSKKLSAKDKKNLERSQLIDRNR